MIEFQSVSGEKPKEKKKKEKKKNETFVSKNVHKISSIFFVNSKLKKKKSK
jgi:hypothetical protein